MKNPFIDQHQDKITGTLSCFDRVVITGTLPDICHPSAMGGYLSYHQIRLFDYAHWAESLREEIRVNAEQLAAEAGIQIEFIRKSKAFRKEDRIQQILAARGDHPELVHIFSATVTCASFQPWHNKSTHHTALKFTTGKCLHYYFYVIDEAFGLCYVRVPTWAPFRLQIYFNGHSWLARQLMAADIPFRMADNAFIAIADGPRAQELANALNGQQLRTRLDQWARRFPRYSASSAPAITGASCRWNTPPMWSSASRPISNLSTMPSCAPRSMSSRPAMKPCSSVINSTATSKANSATIAPRAFRAPGSAIIGDLPALSSTTRSA